MTTHSATTFNPDLVEILALLKQWHGERIDQLKQAMNADKVVVQNDADEDFVLKGETKRGFVLGLHTAIELFSPFPLKVEGSVSAPVDVERTDVDIAFLVEIDSLLEAGDQGMARQMIADWIDELQAEG